MPVLVLGTDDVNVKGHKFMRYRSFVMMRQKATKSSLAPSPNHLNIEVHGKLKF